MKLKTLNAVARAVTDLRNDDCIPEKITVSPSFYTKIEEEFQPISFVSDFSLSSIFGIPLFIDKDATEDVVVE